MANQITKLRHQLEVAQVLTKSHISFVVVPVFNVVQEMQAAKLAAERLEALAVLSEAASNHKKTKRHVSKRPSES